MLHPPASVVHAFVIGRLEWVGAQVEQLGEAQRHERILPDIQTMRSLLGEDELPLVVAQRHQRAVVVEVEELLARVWAFAGEVIQSGCSRRCAP